MKKRVLFVLVIFSSLLTIIGCGKKEETSSKSSNRIVVKDINNNEVVINSPVERIFLGFYLENYIAISGDKNLDRVASMSKGETRDLLNPLWQTYVDMIPSLEEILDTGSIYGDTFSMEKLIESRPDLVILAPFQYDKLVGNIQQLKSLGIPVAVLDYNSLTLENHIKSTIILGELLGAQERAKEIADNYKNQVEDTKRRIKSAKGTKRVYFELANGGAEVYGNSYGNTLWGSIVNSAGGDNIAMGTVEQHAPLNPEYVLSKNPEVVFFAGSTGSSLDNKRFRMGFGISKSDALNTIKPYLKRSGWNQLSAIKNKEVYGVDHGSLRTVYDYVYFQYIAKIIHPEEFLDVDPIKNHIEFYKKYLPVIPEGTFMLEVLKNE